ncbi:GNAT family N-acetyltransferase [Calidifontibacter terrae]
MSASHTVVLREATGDDLHAVIAVGEQTWPATYGPIAGKDYVAMGLAKWWTPEATIPAIRKRQVLVVEVNGDIVGMTSFSALDHHFYIWKLYVLPDFQSHGLGHQLLEGALARARAEGFTEAQLSYLDGNVDAGRFYERHGFTEFEREHGGSGVPDSIWIKKTLEGNS